MGGRDESLFRVSHVDFRLALLTYGDGMQFGSASELSFPKLAVCSDEDLFPCGPYCLDPFLHL